MDQKFAVEEEAKILAAAQSSGCVPKLIDTFHFKNKSVLIMELCEGSTLEHWHRKCQPPKRIMHLIIFRIFEAVKALHRTGVIHNDIKQDNIIVNMEENDCSVRLIDLGHAKFSGNEVFSSMSSEKILNFPHFDPQLADGGRCSEATDLYSLGRLLLDVSQEYKCPVYRRIGEMLCAHSSIPEENDDFLETLCTNCCFQDPVERCGIVSSSSRYETIEF